jgi:polysaccharide biosynthesis protein VpsJ
MIQRYGMTDHIDIANRAKCSIDSLLRWVELNRLKGYDPADGNASYLHSLSFGSALLQRALQQIVLRAPFNIRPLLGIPQLNSTKGSGYMAWGYIQMFRMTRDEQYVDKARQCLGWLIKNRAPNYTQYCWGNHFPYATRAGKLPKYEPTIVWSSLIGQAFIDAYETLGDTKYLRIAMSICEWILRLPREKTPFGDCLSYVAFKQSSIHNSNMLGAALLARAVRHGMNNGAIETARKAIEYSCSLQKKDGSWVYGEHPMYHWVDNFHTGYNLQSLGYYMDAANDRRFEDNLCRGLEYYKKNFFESDGRPKYYDYKTYPIDIQSAAQAIETLVLISNRDTESLDIACKVAEWTITNMQSHDGHFYYRDLGWKKVKTPMIHWGQATMFRALALLLEKTS